MSRVFTVTNESGRGGRDPHEPPEAPAGRSELERLDDEYALVLALARSPLPDLDVDS